jgi:peptide/nickel transport system permease protein
MGVFILRRALSSVIVLFLCSVAVFIGVRALPGDPALNMAGESASPAVLTAIRHQFGLDKPVPVQYGDYLTQVAHGNFGVSTVDQIPVSEILVQRIPVTLELAFLAILVGLLIGVPAGVVSAVRRGKFADYVSNAFGLIGLSVPHFWLGLLAIWAFAVHLHWLPASGFVGLAEDPVENLRRMVLPAIVLGTGLSAVLMRQTRSALLGQLSEDYVRTARAKGLSHGAQIRHALRNSLTTVTTVLGLQLGALISGAVVTEQIFVIPGFGKLTIDSVLQRNYPVIEGVVIVTVFGYVVVNLLVDLGYAWLDPRLRLSGDAR